MPTINRKRPRGGARPSGRRSTRAEEEEEEEEDQDMELEEEEEAPPARRRGQKQPQQQRGSLQVRSRRAAAQEEEEDDEKGQEEDGENGDALRRRKRRRHSADSDEGDEDMEVDDDDGDAAGRKRANDPVAKFVRLALACEYQKKPIRRPEITEKVLAPNHKNDFKAIFDETQIALAKTFGMKLVELPTNKENKTLNQQRRAAAAEAVNQGGKNKKKNGTAAGESSSSSSSAKSWILVSILPDVYRDPEIVALDSENDSALHGFGMMIVALVYLSNRALGDKQLETYLRRFRAEETIAYDGPAEQAKTDVIIANLVKNAYLVKIKDDTPAGAEESFTYKIGPRAKMEMGREGVMKLTKLMFGDDLPDNFEKMVLRSIGQDKDEVEAQARVAAEEREADEEGGGVRRGAGGGGGGGGGGDGIERRGARDNAGGRGRRATAATATTGRGRRRRHDEEEDEEEDEDEEEEEEEEEDDEDE